ncbi:MAG: TolC family protein [Planctomycetaceae bacterium]|jgi:cobalt-zinc-cadmium efflux system outer membrane protein|nr:TolC family protein [Planctomycetaceae bacterium]
MMVVNKVLLATLAFGFTLSVTQAQTERTDVRRVANDHYTATSPVTLFNVPSLPASVQPSFDVTSAPPSAILLPTANVTRSNNTELALITPNGLTTPVVQASSTALSITLPTATETITFATIRENAVKSNPAYAYVYRQRQALNGDRVQAGLPSNPTIGYNGEEMNGDNAGKQGVELTQKIVPKYKRDARVDVARKEHAAAGWQLDTQRQKIINDALLAGCRVAIAEQKLKLFAEMLQIAKQIFDANTSLYENGSITKADYLDSKIQFSRTQIAFGDAEIEYRAACKMLSVLLGKPVEALYHIDDTIDKLPGEFIAEHLFVEIIASSSELREANAKIATAQAKLRREMAEAGIDFDTSAALMWNADTRETEVSVGVAIPLKIFDRNQGNIQRAKAELAAACDNVRRQEMVLSQKFQKMFASYLTARSRVTAYETSILADAKESCRIAAASMKNGEYSAVQQFIAQQTLYSVRIEYLNSLQEFWNAHFMLEGALVSDGLEVK